MVELSIIIVTYNSSMHIYDCLESIFRNNDIGDGLEVIIVDNASGEQSELFSKLNSIYSNRILLINSGRNGGYGFGNNVGIKKSHSNKVIVMNPDVRIIKPIFKTIISRMQNEEIALLGVSFIDGSLPFYFKPEHGNLLKSLFLKQIIQRKKYNPQTMYMSGSFLVFDKEKFFKAGAFDENIFMYYEEPDITNRIISIGGKVCWAKDIYVKHLAHGRQFSEKTWKIMRESYFYYAKKYGVDIGRSRSNAITILRFKLFAAKMLGQKEKALLFKQQVEKFQIELNDK